MRSRGTSLGAALGAVVALVVGLLVAPASPAAAVAGVRITMPGSGSFPGTVVHTGSILSQSTWLARPTVSLAKGTTFVRGKLVVQRRSGSSWSSFRTVRTTKRRALSVALPEGQYRLSLSVRTRAKGRESTTRRTTYLSVARGTPPVVVVAPPPPAPTPPSLVQGQSWYGHQYDDSQDPGRTQNAVWFAVRISNASPTTGLARSRREIALPSMFPSSIYDDVPTLAAAGTGWFVTTCDIGCQIFPLADEIRIRPFSPVPSSIPDAARPRTSQSSVVVAPGPVFDIASVITTVTNPASAPLAAGTPAHVVVLSGQTPVYAFRAVTPVAVAAGSSAPLTLVPTGTTGFRWSGLPDPATTTVQITLDPAP